MIAIKHIKYERCWKEFHTGFQRFSEKILKTHNNNENNSWLYVKNTSDIHEL